MSFLLYIAFLPSSYAIIYLPDQVHLSLSDLDTEMYVTWSIDTEIQNSTIQYTPVTSPTELPSTFLYTSSSTLKKYLNNKYGDSDQRHLFSYTAKMTNLVPGALYKYRVGSDNNKWSDTFIFEAKRDFSTDPSSRVLIYGDLGVGTQIYSTLWRLRQEVETLKYDAIIHNGDFAYNLCSYNGKLGDQFMKAIEPLASKVPYMVSQGNHESKDLINPYLYRFNMPGNSSNLFFSFNLGKVHFVSYSTELMFGDPDENNLIQAQEEFLAQDLGSLNREKYPWLVVFGHRPLYCSPDFSIQDNPLHNPPVKRHNSDCEESAEILRNYFEPLWYKYKVDLVIQSHVHAYERLRSIYQKKSIPCQFEDFNTCKTASAPIYIVTGSPGQQESYAPISQTPHSYSMFQDEKWGYSRLTTYNSTHMLWEQIRSTSFKVIDFLWIIK